MSGTEKEFSTRIALKYDTTDNWNKSTLILKSGELIIYSDGNPNKIKVGDGVHLPNELPFLDEYVKLFQTQEKAGQLLVVNDAGYVESTEITWGLLAGIDESIAYVINNLLYTPDEDDTVENNILYLAEDTYVDDDGILHFE